MQNIIRTIRYGPYLTPWVESSIIKVRNESGYWFSDNIDINRLFKNVFHWIFINWKIPSWHILKMDMLWMKILLKFLHPSWYIFTKIQLFPKRELKWYNRRIANLLSKWKWSVSATKSTLFLSKLYRMTFELTSWNHCLAV